LIGKKNPGIRKKKACIKQRANQGKLPTYMPVQLCVGSKRASPNRYEPTNRTRLVDLFRIKNHRNRPIKAEIQNSKGENAVEEIKPATT
jgi:hypothetical protein